MPFFAAGMPGVDFRDDDATIAHSLSDPGAGHLGIRAFLVTMQAMLSGMPVGTLACRPAVAS